MEHVTFGDAEAFEFEVADEVIAGGVCDFDGVGVQFGEGRGVGGGASVGGDGGGVEAGGAGEWGVGA